MRVCLRKPEVSPARRPCQQQGHKLRLLQVRTRSARVAKAKRIHKEASAAATKLEEVIQSSHHQKAVAACVPVRRSKPRSGFCPFTRASLFRSEEHTSELQSLRH